MITLYSIFQGFIRQTKLYIQSVLPKKVSELTNDVGYLTSHQDISGKQDKLTFDNTPTANSSNPVTSKGIKAALDEKLNVSGNVATATHADKARLLDGFTDTDTGTWGKAPGTIIGGMNETSGGAIQWRATRTKLYEQIDGTYWQREGTYEVIDTGTVNNYAPTKTGVGASGTWPISITGNAETASQAANDGAGNVITDTYVPKKEIKDSTDLNTLKETGFYNFPLSSICTDDNHFPLAVASAVLIFRNGANGDGCTQLCFPYNQDKICKRTYAASSQTWSDWSTSAFLSDLDSKQDKIIEDTAAAHNGIYRGKDLTSYCDSGEMSKAIAAGTFHDIYPGDYIIKDVTINGTKYSNVHWIVMDLDYHLHCGWSSETTKHHIVLMPEEALGTAQMNSSNVTTDGYCGSAMWETTIPLYVTGISNAFGADHILSHYELLTNSTSTTASSRARAGWTGGSTNWTWTQVSVNLCNEPMVYGCTAFSSSGYDIGECNQQLSVFKLNHGLKCSKRYWWWLRSVAGSTNFCICGASGNAATDGASDSDSVRPYFLYC